MQGDDYAAFVSGDTGFLGGVVKSIGKGIGKGAKAVGKVGSKVAKAAVPVHTVARTASDIARGKNVVKSVTRGAKTVVRDARSVARTAAPALQVAAAGASFVPGAGSGVAAGLNAAAAFGRGASLSNMALAAARGALPGGAAAKAAFDLGVGLAKGQSVTGAALAAARRQLPGGPAAQAAFDAAVTLSRGASGQAVQALRNSQHPVARAGFDAALQAAKRKGTIQRGRPARPVVQRAPAPPVLSRAPSLAQRKKGAPIFGARALESRDPLKAAKAPKLRWKSLSGTGAAFVGARSRIKKALLFARSDTRGIEDGGRIYVVEAGDSPWKIAQKLTGNGANYVELLDANDLAKGAGAKKSIVVDPHTKTRNFRFLSTGDRLAIPERWRIAAAEELRKRQEEAERAQAAEPAPVPSAPVYQIPEMPAPRPVALPVPAPMPSPGAMRDDPAAVAEAKAILAAWSKSDGIGKVAVVDYGNRPEDISPIWGPRDLQMLRDFAAWSNTSRGTGLATTGDLSQAHLEALIAWAEWRAGFEVPVAAPPPPGVVLVGGEGPSTDSVTMRPGERWRVALRLDGGPMSAVAYEEFKQGIALKLGDAVQIERFMRDGNTVSADFTVRQQMAVVVGEQYNLGGGVTITVVLAERLPSASAPPSAPSDDDVTPAPLPSVPAPIEIPETVIAVPPPKKSGGGMGIVLMAALLAGVAVLEK